MPASQMSEKKSAGHIAHRRSRSSSAFDMTMKQDKKLQNIAEEYKLDTRDVN